MCKVESGREECSVHDLQFTVRKNITYRGDAEITEKSGNRFAVEDRYPFFAFNFKL
jgi:hypothetical protein